MTDEFALAGTLEELKVKGPAVAVMAHGDDPFGANFLGKEDTG